MRECLFRWQVRSRTASVAALFAVCLAAPAFAAEDDAALKIDLSTVLALKRLPCGEVASVTTKAENDHLASCTDGNRYHIFINGQGQVVVEKQ